MSEEIEEFKKKIQKLEDSVLVTRILICLLSVVILLVAINK
jgi:hypothetical protein